MMLNSLTTTQFQLMALLRFALHTEDGVAEELTDEDIDWQGVYDEAKRQSVVGVTFAGVSRLKHIRQLNIGAVLFAKWYGLTEKNRKKNVRLNELSLSVCRRLGKDGFRTCILKGQGNSLLYEARQLDRAAGDIDIWMMPEGVRAIDDSRHRIIAFVKGRFPDIEGAFIHIDFPIKTETPVEIHFTPTMDGNPWTNRRLQQLFHEEQDACFCNITSAGFAVPTNVVNLVFQIHHVKRHFINEGVGLRHIVDLCLLLESMTEEECREAYQVVCNLCMKRFAAALMYVLRMLGCRNVLCPPDEKLGSHMLKVIFEGGNFGKYSKEGSVVETSFFRRWYGIVKRAQNISWYYPGDSFWSLVFRLRVGMWKMMN